MNRLSLFVNCRFFKWANSALFLFIFVHFQTQIYRKNCFSGFQTRIARVEGELCPLDHHHDPSTVGFLTVGTDCIKLKFSFVKLMI